MGAVSSAEKRPGGTRLTCSIAFKVLEMKEARKRKPGAYCVVEMSREDLDINIYPNGRTEDLKGLLSIGLMNTGRGEVKMESVKITLGGKSTLAKDRKIPAGQGLS